MVLSFRTSPGAQEFIKHLPFLLKFLSENADGKFIQLEAASTQAAKVIQTTGASGRGVIPVPGIQHGYVDHRELQHYRQCNSAPTASGW